MWFSPRNTRSSCLTIAALAVVAVAGCGDAGTAPELDRLEVDGPAFSHHGPAAANGGNKATGGVTTQFAKLSFNAHGDHPRHGVRGNVSYERLADGASFKGSVNVCYHQDDNEAVFVGTIEDADGFVVGDEFRISVQDNSPGGSGAPDRSRVQVGQFDENDCVLTTFPGVRREGNLTVH